MMMMMLINRRVNLTVGREKILSVDDGMNE
jgi:hypothetical protein